MNQLAQLWVSTNQIIGELDEWVLRTDGKEVRLRFKKIDQVRLLKLRVWSFRYQMEISDILDLIMPILRAQMHYKKKRYGLGVSIRSLTGKGAERILTQELKRHDPEGDHIQV